MRDRIRRISSLAILLLPALSWGADLDKGLAAYDEGDYATALAECQPLAEAGNAIAQFCMGRMYANGFGVPMDDALALQWFGAAAEQGHSEAQFNLGVFHSNGWGVPMDGLEADKWYHRAAEQGFVQAQLMLARNYHKGRGVEQDLIEAYMWYEIARQFGDDEAQIGIDEVAEELSPEQLAQAEIMTQQWLTEHDGESLRAGVIKQ
jgi:hypothetical protein